MRLGSERLAGSEVKRRSPATWAFDAAIVLAGLVTLSLSLAGALAPRFTAVVLPAALSADGGHAFVFSPHFVAHWPYAVPSHPGDTLAPGDVGVTEDGRTIGALDPAHADIRERGGGLYNIWDGALWFSPSDDSDPRTNGRRYRMTIKGRLDPALSIARRWSIGLFAVLAAFRIMAAGAARVAGPLRRAARGALARMGGLLARVPLDFRRGFCLVCVLGLGAFAWNALSRPMPLVFEIDSFTYVQPGILWDAGRDVAGQSSRDVGYPALAALALAMGSLGRLPLLQLGIVLLGLACILAVLYRAFRLTAERLFASAGLPVALTGVCACLAVVGYLALMFGHDLFVIDIYSAMGEAPHVLPTAAAFALFVGSWTTRRPARALCSAVGAATAAYLSIMVKPHTSMVLALCLSSLAVVALYHLRAFRSPAVLAICLAAAAAVGVVHRADAIVTARDADFGPKTIFCNHLDVVLPAFDASTAERARVATLMGNVLRAPSTWTLMGFDGDRCVYDPAMTDAIKAAAGAEGMSTAAWQNREFIRAVAARPAAYAKDVFRQLADYMLHPVVDVDHHGQSVMPDDVWERFAPFMGRIRMTRDQFVGEVGSWVPTAYPRLAGWGKLGLYSVVATFAVFTLGGTALALGALATMRGRVDLRLEAVVVATGAFTMAFVMTTALAHSFDIGRYLTDILPFTLIWWFVSAAYLAQILVLFAASAVREGGLALERPVEIRARRAGLRLRTGVGPEKARTG